MAVGKRRCHAASDGSLHQTLLNEVGLHHVFKGFTVFPDGTGKVVDADRAPRKLFNDGEHKAPVDRIESDGIDVEHFECCGGHFLRDFAVVPYLRVVAHAPQQPVGDAGRAAGAAGNFGCPFRRNRNVK